MNNTDTNGLSKILAICLVVMIFILFILIAIYLIIKVKQRVEKKSGKNDTKFNNNSTPEKSKKGGTTYKGYTKNSILDFMEFEDIQDNMIIQKDGKRFLMVIQCQGINYDLMSHMEKVSVEEGFQQFLNTLRHPIQLYIQTRSVNLESSIGTYNKRLKDIEDKLNRLKFQYEQMKASGGYKTEQLQRYQYEIKKQQNLYEYGKDIIKNTENMNKNRNVLSKQYYVIVPYYSEEDEKYDKEEIKNMAFSELYTKSQAIIRTLMACSVVGKILNSRELIDLLYVAYNRDEAETFGIDQALRAGYNELYSTSQDVYEKKIQALDEVIEDRAIEIANSKVEKAKSIVQENAEQKEDDIEELAAQLAKVILGENESYLGKEVADVAKQEIDKDMEEASKNVQKKTKIRRPRKSI